MRRIDLNLWLCTAWVIFGLAPAIFLVPFLDVLDWYKIVLSRGEALALVSGAVSTLVIEYLLIVWLLRPGRNFALQILGNLTALTWIVFVIASWGAFATRRSFLLPNDAALSIYLADITNLQNFMSERDIGIASALGVLFIIAIILFKRIARLATAETRWLPGFLAVGTLGVSLHVSSLSSDATLVIRHYFSPQLSVATWAMLENSEPTAPPTDDLLPAYDFHSWGGTIAPDYSPKENIVVVAVEALRADQLEALGGDPRVMPFLNQLAHKATLFSRAYTVAPETAYAQASIITGLYPLKLPVRDFFLDLDYPFARIYELLKIAGYRTGYFTTEWTISRRLSRSDSLDRYLDPQVAEVQNVGVARDAAAPPLDTPLTEIDRINAADLAKFARADTTPFFALLYLGSSHFPYLPSGNAPAPFTPVSLPRSVSFLEQPMQYRAALYNRYRNSLRFIDELLRDLFAQLTSSAPHRPITFIVTGDHGQLFGEHGEFVHGGLLREPVLHVPLLLFRSTDRDASQPKRIDTPVSSIDIAPSVLAVAGLPPYHGFQGVNLLVQPDEHRPVFSTTQVLPFEDSIVVGRYRYTRDARTGLDRLSDVTADPAEERDLTQDLPEIVKRLSAALTDFRARQLGYFAQPPPVRARHFAPRIRPVPFDTSIDTTPKELR